MLWFKIQVSKETRQDKKYNQPFWQEDWGKSP
jgi:hypothetical protein